MKKGVLITIIIIVVLLVISIPLIGTLIVNGNMNNAENKACCMNKGGIWSGNHCCITSDNCAVDEIDMDC